MDAASTIRRFARLAGAVFSGLVLAACFPPFELGDLAWFALAPLVLSSIVVPPRRAFGLGFAAGAAFWLFSIFWLRHVTWWGWFGLSLYCAAWFMPFAAVVSWWGGRFGTVDSWKNLALMVLATATWAGFEYLRSVLFTGFPWNPLGACQYRNLAVIQVARWTGVYGVSALVAWVNMAVALTVLRYVRERNLAGLRLHPEFLVALAVVVAAVGTGWRVLREPDPPSETLRVTMVQPNIPQEDKWTPETFDMIYARLRQLTGAAVHAGQPDLIVWPETALPDDVRNSEASYQLVYEMVTNGVPLLVGSMDIEWRDDGEPYFFNSSFLYDAGGFMLGAYDKRHLVIFGEYVPLRRWFPFLKTLTPIQESFSPGSTSTVFRLERPPAAFSVLICFEDTVASLARESVRNGARLLINQTNDAWFDPSSASRQHMIQCVFRCVENGVPAVRCANSGVSCCITRKGRVHDVLDDGKGNVAVAGIRAASVRVPGAEMPVTFYTAHGDVFAGSCAAAGAGLLIFVLGSTRRAATLKT